jgi:hypothetical protein
MPDQDNVCKVGLPAAVNKPLPRNYLRFFAGLFAAALVAASSLAFAST